MIFSWQKHSKCWLRQNCLKLPVYLFIGSYTLAYTRTTIHKGPASGGEIVNFTKRPGPLTERPGPLKILSASERCSSNSWWPFTPRISKLSKLAVVHLPCHWSLAQQVFTAQCSVAASWCPVITQCTRDTVHLRHSALETQCTRDTVH